MLNSTDEKNFKDGSYSNHQNVKKLFEERAKTNETISNFNLSYANLSNINLVNKGSHSGYKINNCDFYKTNFENAHCFKVDFSGSSLMKANFKKANLHFANLRNCNLLGTNFDHAKLENVIWDENILQEREAHNSSNFEEKLDYYQQAEEIYRNLRKITEADGLFETAGWFFQKEMKMRRKQMPRYSLKRFISKIVEFSCGYGERPLRIVLISALVIIVFSMVFFLTGLNYNDQTIIFSFSNSLFQNIENFFNSLYFSVVTFTTLGYGDILPLGISKFFAAIEALLGGFILALFVVVFVKKMTR